MGQRITQLSSFVNGSRRFGSHVAADTAGKGELPKQLFHAFGIFTQIGVELAVTAFQPGVGDQPGPAMTGAGDVDHIQCVGLDHAIAVGVDEV